MGTALTRIIPSLTHILQQGRKTALHALDRLHRTAHHLLHRGELLTKRIIHFVHKSSKDVLKHRLHLMALIAGGGLHYARNFVQRTFQTGFNSAANLLRNLLA